MNDEQKPKRRIKVPDDMDLARFKKMKSHWDWYWLNQYQDKPKKIIIDFDNLPPE
jgi:hypothetical protein